jgi:hypothetical protein
MPAYEDRAHILDALIGGTLAFGARFGGLASKKMPKKETVSKLAQSYCNWM